MFNDNMQALHDDGFQTPVVSSISRTVRFPQNLKTPPRIMNPFFMIIPNTPKSSSSSFAGTSRIWTCASWDIRASHPSALLQRTTQTGTSSHQKSSLRRADDDDTRQHDDPIGITPKRKPKGRRRDSCHQTDFDSSNFELKMMMLANLTNETIDQIESPFEMSAALRRPHSPSIDDLIKGSNTPHQAKTRNIDDDSLLNSEMNRRTSVHNVTMTDQSNEISPLKTYEIKQGWLTSSPFKSEHNLTAQYRHTNDSEDALQNSPCADRLSSTALSLLSSSTPLSCSAVSTSASVGTSSEYIGTHSEISRKSGAPKNNFSPLVFDSVEWVSSLPGVIGIPTTGLQRLVMFPLWDVPRFVPIISNVPEK